MDLNLMTRIIEKNCHLSVVYFLVCLFYLFAFTHNQYHNHEHTKNDVNTHAHTYKHFKYIFFWTVNFYLKLFIPGEVIKHNELIT